MATGKLQVIVEFDRKPHHTPQMIYFRLRKTVPGRPNHGSLCEPHALHYFLRVKRFHALRKTISRFAARLLPTFNAHLAEERIASGAFLRFALPCAQTPCLATPAPSPRKNRQSRLPPSPKHPTRACNCSECSSQMSCESSPAPPSPDRSRPSSRAIAQSRPRASSTITISLPRAHELRQLPKERPLAVHGVKSFRLGLRQPQRLDRHNLELRLMNARQNFRLPSRAPPHPA